MNFLTAKWKHLLLASYVVSEDCLKALVPDGCMLDRYEGDLYISLVAFLFQDTRVLGVPIPFHVNFEEVNLRFYVTPTKDPSRRAVTFIREIVPRFAIPLVANNLFQENYVACPMSYETSGSRHTYQWKNARWNSLSGTVTGAVQTPAVGSLGEFITEHYFGYARRGRRTLEYRVEHPQWRCVELDEYRIDIDFRATYGAEWEFLKDIAPRSVIYADGSAVSVSFPRILRP